MAKKRVSKHWTEEDARRVLREAERSGLGDGAFAKRRGLYPQRLYWWRKKLGGSVGVSKTAKVSERVSFVEVRPRASASSVGLEVRLTNGRIVSVDSSIDPKILGPLLDAIDGRPC